MNEDNEELKWIKAFSKITIANVCKDLKIDKSNLWAGRTSDNNISKVKNEIQKRLREL